MDFIHKTSSPDSTQSNGFVERAIQTIKKTLRKCRKDASDSYLSMLALRTTKNTSCTSLELLMKKKLRTKRQRKLQHLRKQQSANLQNFNH